MRVKFSPLWGTGFALKILLSMSSIDANHPAEVHELGRKKMENKTSETLPYHRMWV
jgi:hypothetical protein